MNKELMFSSKYDAWGTPKAYFEYLETKFDFDIDVCASDTNKKCDLYFTENDNALLLDWRNHFIEQIDCAPTCFMNPPYGRGIGKFVEKAYNESLKGCEVVCLLPARTDTKWFHEYCIKGNIEFIKGRLTFGSDEYWQEQWDNGSVKYGKKNPAPFPSMLVIFNPRKISDINACTIKNNL